MAKVRVTMGTKYCNCSPESIEFEIDGKANEKQTWEAAGQEALNLACDGFVNYYLLIEVVENNENFEE
jgi:hypothetical protein